MISEMINSIGNPYPSRKIALLTVNGNHIEPEILTYHIHSPRGVPGLLSPPLRCEFIVSTTYYPRLALATALPRFLIVTMYILCSQP
jgi:hypothetical protein